MPTSLTLRSVKGSALTHGEVDDNFTALRGGIDTPAVSVIGTNSNAVAGTAYAFTASLTLTLPPSPSAGLWVDWMDRSGTTTCVIDRNGQNIMGLPENLTLDSANSAGRLRFVDATRGWVIC